MHIINLKILAPDQWQPQLLDNYPYLPYWWVRGVAAESRQQLMAQMLETAVHRPDHYLLGCVNGQEDLVGFALLHRLDWDSDHFGIDVWRLAELGVWGSREAQRRCACMLAHVVVAQARDAGADTIQTNIPLDAIDTIHALEDTGFRTMETQVLWLYDLRRQEPPPLHSPYPIRLYREADAASIISLAREAYTPTPDRFHADPHLPTAASDSLYAQWVANSCTGEQADCIAIADDNGQPIAYGTLRYRPHANCSLNIAQFLLGAVHPAYRNCSLNHDIMVYLLGWLKTQGADAAYVGTQANNVPSQISFTKLGFRPVRGALSLHCWL